MNSRPLTLAIVGAGPRGLSVLERTLAGARTLATRPLTVHVIDPFPPGAGAVWRTDQPAHLLMNTVASQVTVFTDASVRMKGPLVHGPSLYQWARSLPRSRTVHPAWVLEQARTLRPDAYPTRAFYGHYLRWAFAHIVSRAPAHTSVRTHATRATALEDTGPHPHGPQTLRLADGTVLTGLDAVVLAQGHTPVRPTAAESGLAAYAARHQLRYLAPANPADLDLSAIAPGETVLLRGLGLNFFDHMALFTLGRGGTFHRRQGRLAYRPSGREPRLVAGSRRGVPYHARGENEKGAFGRHTPRLLTAERIARLRRQQPLDFAAQLWPLIATEVEAVYYRTLLAAEGRPRAGRELAERYLAAPSPQARASLLDTHHVAAGRRWDWEQIAKPYKETSFTGPGDFTAWLLAHLRRDVDQARQGNLSGPVKAALDVLRDLRNEIRQVVDHGGLSADSHREDLERWYTPLNAYLSIGPPASRIEEMAALIEAGVLDVIGPEVDIRPAQGPDGPVFAATSAAVPGRPVTARTLIEARLPDGDLHRTADPLLRHLLVSGQARLHTLTGPHGDYETGGLAVTARPYHLIDSAGRAHPRRFAYGVPTEAVHWATAAGIRPGVDSVILGDADAIARSLLALPAHSTPPGYGAALTGRAPRPVTDSVPPVMAAATGRE
ncbi:FAD/NAD(P)-binding domain-containing protein [Streptomyces sp. MNP-20]|uniref:FAD/NAD(P)-binding protein n=1 Tax=Streptomyces sp. MNP-20 TaxID=2721165 RepID=UPI001551EAB8|nr:FAD/NAD(P)-binding protein [Streptomyces sp. MNP-20]